MTNLENTKTNHFFSKILLAIFIVPLGSSESWQAYKFSKIPPNKILYSENGLKIEVDQSASPLIYAFDEPLSLDEILVEAEVLGTLPNFSTDVTQGEKKYDDFILRVGLITEGEERLNWLQRQLAPDWLIDMEKRVPKQKGIDKVYFLTTCRQKKLLGKVRKHALNSKLVEECITPIEKSGPFVLKKKWQGSPKILGLWVGSDGDDRGSRFEVLIKKIHIIGK